MNQIRPTLAVAALVAFCISHVAANAASVVGTIGFNIQGNVSGASPDLSRATTFTNLRTNNTATANWESFTSSHYTGGILAADALHVGDFDSTGNAFAFSHADFGSFVGSVSDDNLQVINIGFLQSSTRSLKIVGLFTPGLTLIEQGYNNVVRAELSVFFQGFTGQRTNFLPGARSGTVVMSTQPVPEPTTCMIALVGAAAYAGFHLRSKRNRQRRG